VFFLRDVVWGKPFSLAGVGQLAADIYAVAVSISKAFGYGMAFKKLSSGEQRATKSAKEFSFVDSVLAANPCIKEVQVRLISAGAVDLLV